MIWQADSLCRFTPISAASMILVAPLSLVVAATATLSNDASKAIASFSILSQYTGAYAYKDPQRGNAFQLMWASVIVMG